jgi:hypothetical protein
MMGDLVLWRELWERRPMLRPIAELKALSFRSHGLGILVVVLALAGCSPRQASHPAVSDLAGTYSGTWEWLGSDPSGAILLVVDSEGLLNGTFEDARYPVLGSIFGEIQDGGYVSFSGLFYVPGYDLPFGEKFRGHLVLLHGGQLTRTLTRALTEPPQRVYFNMARVNGGLGQ